ncbi:phosphoribosylformylglycinamidine synthase subunit PurS [Arsenicicoccus piscis]|uniref:Phosphoribosylformylglycinamidine synthase n=1 Tax=Arsenicicoccus piscis TaxID=673954 RepID=A0ABQ6HS49_9MICO|nr:phosphoribosylformylglycinamidine synthase subunit PurS [Arsenicicoccus piscis]MCH8626259.1 phosphoribosylformylglycinamidine synthase subunit PurS [Arsenicicoccus piscis]GMA20852.1 hypothetical protein GCM10025862_28730 [Arsenicicoccus piscis]
MGRIVVNVMLKPQLPDREGGDALAALGELGYPQFHGARVGRRYVLLTHGEVTEEQLAQAREAAERAFATGEGEEVTGVFAEGSTVRVGDFSDEDWEAYGAQVGESGLTEDAVAHQPRHLSQPHDVRLSQAGAVEAGGFYGDQDDD